MAKIPVQIKAAVGKRNGITPLANQAQDVATITDLLDRLSAGNGGTGNRPGAWPTDKVGLIDELATRIRNFQVTQKMARPDSAVDPQGTTLNRMNLLAAELPLAAMPASFGNAYKTDFIAAMPYVATDRSLPGRGPLEPMRMPVEYSRRLVKVTGSSIRWFGVVLPTRARFSLFPAVPHIFFTPTPVQGGYSDGNYENFAGWGRLWDDYTSRIGGLVAASLVNQVLVIPFYQTSQMNDLGVFLTHWPEVISRVVTAAANDMNPYILPGAFAFNSIVTSSFSNGVNAHRGFHTRGAGAADMTSVLFDLDGQAQTGGSNWRPPKGVIYLNTGAPGGTNPQGRNFYVGGRWGRFDSVVGPTTQYSHHACSEYLLSHGLYHFSS